MRLHTYITTFSLLLLIAVGGLVSCKEKTGAVENGTSEAPQAPEATVIGTLEGTLGDEPFSATLNEQDSQFTIEEWDGLSTKSKQRDGGEMSLEAFLMGTDLWSGPPRLVTITHHVDGVSLTLRFAGRLAVDEKLTALPGCLIETADAPLVPATKGSWTTAKNVTLPHYDFILRVTSFDEPSKVITGVIEGQLINPTKPNSDPLPLELAVSSEKAPESVAELEAQIPTTDTAPPVATTTQEDDKTSAESEQNEVNEPLVIEATPAEVIPAEEDENTASLEPEATPSEVTPTEEEKVEIRPAIPYKPSRGF